MDRELTDVKLPSGKVARIVTYFTHGEEMAIDKAKWTGAVVKNADDNVIIENVPINQDALTQDAIVFQGTKSIDNTEVNREIVDNLSKNDFDFLLAKLLKVREPKKKRAN